MPPGYPQNVNGVFRSEVAPAARATISPHGQPIELDAARTIWSGTSNPAEMKSANRIAASLDYMMAHLNEPMRISTLSALVGLSPSSFFAIFKRATGDTPLNWFINARMRWAAELLSKSDLPIKEIAGRVGYADPYYFSRLFKSVHDLSPKKYRAWMVSNHRGIEG